MPLIPEPQVACAPTPCVVLRMARAQAAIRALIGRGTLSRAERLELAQWQREWVAAWQDSQYVIAA